MSPMNMMWISFYSMGFMALSMALMYISRHKISNGIISGVIALIAYSFLLIGFLTMIFVIFTW
ncbi:DUF2768 domain-containing protein [Kurthia sibirica]|uniref:DUF2768 domain-containing protein n=1 Tax=Kurthia sibirica TaxID=202750 RepID=A0A2U3AIV7_9BACL|nr:DUF2768 domain-containing protein [Kurthia sibirica]